VLPRFRDSLASSTPSALTFIVMSVWFGSTRAAVPMGLPKDLLMPSWRRSAWAPKIILFSLRITCG